MRDRSIGGGRRRAVSRFAGPGLVAAAIVAIAITAGSAYAAFVGLPLGGGHITPINIFDGEIITLNSSNEKSNDKSNETKIRYYLIFDVLMVNGNDYTMLPFTTRISMLDTATKFANTYIKSIAKRYTLLTDSNFTTVIPECFKGKYPKYDGAEIKYERDGLYLC